MITTDALVEGVHFRRDLMSAHDVGVRALASNLSDIAAMGARPVLATIVLGIPPDVDEAWILACYEGIASLAHRAGTPIVGGDLTRAPALTLAITVVGEVRPANRKTRDGAKPGDVLAVTGPLGASSAGLRVLLERPELADDPVLAEAVRTYRTPEPRLAEGRWLGASRHVHAMMDCSDGLSTDVARMCSRSRCGAVLEVLPAAASVVQWCAQTGGEPASYVLGGGEDFELIVAVGGRAFAHLAERFRQRFGKPLIAVGHFTEGSGVQMQNAAGELAHVPHTGWDHMRG